MVSFGRIGLAIAGGLAEGASEVIDENQKKAEKEIERRDRLFQQAMRYADEDKTKYEKARADKSEMLSLALEDVRSMGLADDSQTQMVLAANMVKEAGSKEALTKRLEKIREGFAVNPEMVRGGYTPLTSNLDKETLKNVTFDTLTEQLVPSYQRAKGLGSYYQPSPYEGRGLFKDVGRKDIARQEEQFKQTAEAFGLGKRAIGELPSMGALPSADMDIPEVRTAKQLFAMASAFEAAGRTEEAEKYYTRAETLAKKEQEATAKPDKARTPVSVREYMGQFREAKSNPRAFHASDAKMTHVLGLEAAADKKGVGVEVAAASENQAVYQALVRARTMEDVNTINLLQNIDFAATNLKDPSKNETFKTAFNYRNGTAQPLNEYLNSLKSIDIKSEEYQNLPIEVKHLSTVLKAYDNTLLQQPKNEQDRKFKQNRLSNIKKNMLDPLLRKGYFVPESAIRSYNINVVLKDVLGPPKNTGEKVVKAPTSVTTKNTSKDKTNSNKMVDPNAKEEINESQASRFSSLIKRALPALEAERAKNKSAIEKRISSLKKDIEGMPKWMRTRQRKEEQLRELENELRNFK